MFIKNWKKEIFTAAGVIRILFPNNIFFIVRGLKNSDK